MARHCIEYSVEICDKLGNVTKRHSPTSVANALLRAITAHAAGYRSEIVAEMAGDLTEDEMEDVRRAMLDRAARRD